MPNNKFELLGQTVLPGKGILLNLDIAKLHTGTKIEVPIIVQRGKKPGPVLLLTGGIHGNEVNGVEIVRQLISKKYNRPQCGTVICMPVVNIFGFLNQTRQFPDGRDLNRVFPGSARGSLASRFAYHIMKEIAPVVDYCIDYHTGAESRFNAPQTRINKDDAESMELAKVFGSPFVMLANTREKSFREALAKMGKKVLLFEGGKSLDINNGVTQSGIAGALRVMDHLGMRDFAQELGQMEAKAKNPVTINKSQWVRAKYSGMFHPYIALGSEVKKGDLLGSVSDPFGNFERSIKAVHDGHIICINQSPIVNQGDAIFHISQE
ncbi:succinylglutamate desuccinylase/aspartoacylase family protein [Arenibacter sp. 6A1]|uniref:succinylglutamate desuccinylase/aspartoacylase family protein n=1 Tax=Arenibacter sp. 6A1 TaxID=2720391 RepID=UPI001444EA1B|nr:succinylglutamate desuccinylase/aspartoacylase family protein [Arenibacter sp. 6A1]NKI25462.1 succinylglutamate desuccinylase/aspartoacylase family protein [Arenibacter sp. 6A1]